MKRRDKIIEKAVELFNKKGVAKVTTNHIAKAMEISPGNLYYHFSSKEDIIRSIFDLISDEFDNYWDIKPEKDISTFLPEMITKLMNNHLKYSFFYNDLSQILENDSKLKSAYNQLRRQRQDELKNMFLTLTERGIFEEKIQDDVEQLVERIWFITEFWITFKKTQDSKITEAVITEAIDFMFNILSLYYTKKGRTLQKQILEEL